MIEPITKILIFVIINKTILSFSLLHKNRLRPRIFEFNHLVLCNHSKKCESDIPPPQKKDQCIIMVKDGRVFCKSKLNLYLCANEYLSNKELITISPGGLKGFYLLGILSYIKDTYDTENIIFSGASAGSWNSLFMCYKGNPKEFIYDLMNSIVVSTKSIMEMQYFMKYKILSKYKTEDFDLKKLFVGVSKLNGLSISSQIFTEFNSLEDAINCCMASSHIPIITGGISNKYNNMFSLDGGLSDYPYLDMKSKLHVHPGMWKKMGHSGEEKKKENFFVKILRSVLHFSDYFSIKKNNPIALFDDGYQDAKMNSEYLDQIFTRKQTDIENIDNGDDNRDHDETTNEDIGIEI